VDAAGISLLVLGVVIALFVWNRMPVEVVSIGSALVLAATGVITLPQAFAGFGDSVVVFIAALFVVSEGVDATGLTGWAGQRLLDVAGDDRRRIVVLVLLLCAGLAALITVNGAVAALLPMAVVLALRTGLAPGRLAMPLAFAGASGSLLALTGTPINVIVSEAAVAEGQKPFGFFEFAWVGVPLVLGTLAICLWLGPRLLPVRESLSAAPDLSDHARTLVEHYAIATDRYQVHVRERSPWIGRALPDIDLDGYEGLTLTAVQRGDTLELRDAAAPIESGDIVVLTGPSDVVSRIVVNANLSLFLDAASASAEHAAPALVSTEFGVAEVVVPPRSPLVGETVVPGMVRADGRVVLALQRLGRDLGPAPVVLEVGDTMLVQGRWAALDRSAGSPDLLVVDSPDLVRRQAAPVGRPAVIAAVILGLMVVAMASGVVAPVVAALLAAGAMVLARVVSVEQTYRSMSWTTLILIGGMIPLTVAMQESGAADRIAARLLDVVGGGSPYLLLVGLFVITAAMGQFVSNTATALIMVPIAASAATELGLSTRPFLMFMTVAAASSFLTPVATPANMMVIGPGGYRFGDYWRLGIVVMAWFLLVGLVVVPRVWGW
jgi:di/tricarboxylate transporter